MGKGIIAQGNNPEDAFDNADKGEELEDNHSKRRFRICGKKLTTRNILGLGATMAKILWKDEPDEKDYEAASNYLSLLIYPKVMVQFLRETGMSSFKARDIIRASELPILGVDNAQVMKDVKKIKDGERLSPVLLVSSRPLIIADGYHRVCAAWRVDETQEIPCKIVSL